MSKKTDDLELIRKFSTPGKVELRRREYNDARPWWFYVTMHKGYIAQGTVKKLDIPNDMIASEHTEGDNIVIILKENVSLELWAENLIGIPSSFYDNKAELRGVKDE